MSFGLLYNGIIKPREKVLFLFCVLHLNKTKHMTEKQMGSREYTDHLKNFKKVITVNI